MNLFQYSSNCNRELICVASVALLLSVGASAEKLAIRIAATVNNDVVLVNEVEERMRIFREEQRANGRLVQTTPELYNLILNALIDRKLQLQRAETLGVLVELQRVDDMITGLVQQSGRSRKEFLDERDVELDDLRADVHDDLLIAEAAALDNREKMDVSGEVVDEVLRDRLGENRLHEFLIENAIYDESDMQQAVALSKISDDQFLETARKNAKNADNLQLGWILAEKMPSAYREALNELSGGDISPVLELPNGLHVLHLVAIRPLVPGRIKPKLALMRLLKFDASVDDVRLKEIVEQLSGRETTMEEAAISLDGEILNDWYEIRNLPKQMQHELRFKAGVLGGPFPFEDGKAIALVLDVKEQFAGSEQIRQQAEQIAIDEKFQKLQKEWIENLRSISRIVILHGAN